MEIFVGNLSFDTTQQDLSSAFEKFGTVSNIKMLTDRETGSFRGIAFISMADEAQGQEAINSLNGSEFLGRNIKVEKSQPREKKFGGGGFGGGGFRKPFGGGNRGGNDRGKPFSKRY